MSEEKTERIQNRQLLAKGDMLVNNVTESSAVESINKKDKQWETEEACAATYNPESLLNQIELTPHLTPSINAYEQNIPGYGYKHVLKETWMNDLESKEAKAEVKSALEIEYWVKTLEDKIQADIEANKKPQTEYDIEPKVVTEAEINTAIQKLKLAIKREQYLFKAFFETCCSDMSFTKLRRITRRDIESHGWGGWELLKDKIGRLKRIKYIPGYTIRPLKSKGVQVQVEEPDPMTLLSKDRTILVNRTFRLYVQVVEDRKVFFKSPGDPRVVSMKTGKVYDTLEDLKAPNNRPNKPGEGEDAVPANELLYFSLHDPRTPCPPPRWIGNLLRVLGTREADETNYFYLNNNSIPPAILMVSGGVISKQSRRKIESKIEAEISGSGKNHRLLVIEANAAGKTPNERNAQPTLSYQSMKDARQTDGMFGEYDKNSADSIGASFRLSPLLRGYTPSDLNRATALAAMSFSEQQVFGLLRDDEDWVINKIIIMLSLHFKFVAFKSNSPPTTSMEETSDLIAAAAPHGGLIPNEIRGIIGDVTNKDIPVIEEDWARQPISLTLSGVNAKETENTDLQNKLNNIENKVAAIVTAELREAGYDMSVKATYLDTGKSEDDEEDL